MNYTIVKCTPSCSRRKTEGKAHHSYKSLEDLYSAFPSISCKRQSNLVSNESLIGFGEVEYDTNISLISRGIPLLQVCLLNLIKLFSLTGHSQPHGMCNQGNQTPCKFSLSSLLTYCYPVIMKI